MKIAFVIQDLFGRGAEYATALLVRGFAAKGYDVDLLLSKVHADKLAEGMKPFDIPASVHVVHLARRKARYNVLQLRHYLKTTDAVAVVQMGGGYEQAVALAALGLCRKPRLYAVKHTIDFALDAELKYRLKDDSPLTRLKHWWRYRAYDGVLCVAETVRREMIRLHHLPEHKVHVVYNPAVDDSFFERLRKPATHPWFRDRTVPVFVAAGAFMPEKGHLMVMEAFRIANATRPVRLVIFGQGDLRDDYEQFISRHGLEEVVSLPGFSSSLPAEIAASNGFISSSRIESFGIAIVEGLACGVPVICTDAPCGPREILEDGKYGRLVPPDSPESLADAVLAALDSGSGLAMSNDSWKRFSLDAIVSRYECALGILNQ